MSYSLSLGGHKEGASDDEKQRVKESTAALVDELERLGFSCTGSLNVDGESTTYSVPPAAPAPGPEEQTAPDG